MHKLFDSQNFDFALLIYGSVAALINLILILMAVSTGIALSRIGLILTILGAALFLPYSIQICLSGDAEDDETESE